MYTSHKLYTRASCKNAIKRENPPTQMKYAIQLETMDAVRVSNSIFNLIHFLLHRNENVSILIMYGPCNFREKKKTHFVRQRFEYLWLFFFLLLL